MARARHAQHAVTTCTQRAHRVGTQWAHMHMHGTGREEEHVVEIMPDRGARLVQRGHRREMALDGEIPDETHHAARLACRAWTLSQSVGQYVVI